MSFDKKTQIPGNATRVELYGYDMGFKSFSLRRIQKDLYRILNRFPNEVPAVLQALRDGRVNGNMYIGKCACLIGTIANAQDKDISEFYGYTNPDSPIENWFLCIHMGDSPKNSLQCAVTEGWILEWQSMRGEGDLINQGRK